MCKMSNPVSKNANEKYRRFVIKDSAFFLMNQQKEFSYIISQRDSFRFLFYIATKNEARNTSNKDVTHRVYQTSHLCGEASSSEEFQ